MKMTRFGYRFDLIRERHVSKDEAKIASRGTDWDDIISIEGTNYIIQINISALL